MGAKGWSETLMYVINTEKISGFTKKIPKINCLLVTNNFPNICISEMKSWDCIGNFVLEKTLKVMLKYKYKP